MNTAFRVSCQFVFFRFSAPYCVLERFLFPHLPFTFRSLCRTSFCSVSSSLITCQRRAFRGDEGSLGAPPADKGSIEGGEEGGGWWGLVSPAAFFSPSTFLPRRRLDPAPGLVEKVTPPVQKVRIRIAVLWFQIRGMSRKHDSPQPNVVISPFFFLPPHSFTPRWTIYAGVSAKRKCGSRSSARLPTSW